MSGKLLPAPSSNARPPLPLSPPDAPAPSEKLPRRFYALARNASAVTEGELAVIVRASEGLGADGCDFIAALYWLLSAAGFSEGPRSFVCAVAASIQRAEREADETQIADEELSELMGCSAKTVQRKRGRYLAEEQAQNFAILGITEGDFDHATGKNRLTSYRFLSEQHVVATVQQARGSELWERNSRAALRAAAYEVFADIPDAPPAVKKRRKKERSVESEIQAVKETIKTKCARLRDLELKRRGDVAQLWAELLPELEEIIGAPAFRQFIAKKEDHPMGGQNVHPSPEAVHPSPMVGEPESEIFIPPGMPIEEYAQQYEEGSTE